MSSRSGERSISSLNAGRSSRQPLKAMMHGDDDDQNNQSPRRGRDARRDDSLERMKRDHARRQQQHRGNHRGGERLGLAVAVGMILVRRRLGDDESAPNDDGTKDVRERFHRVGDERLRMAEDAREKFRDGQRDVCGEAEERGAETALQAVGWHAGNCSGTSAECRNIFFLNAALCRDVATTQIRWQNIPSRSFGSNQVLFGGMISSASAMVIKSSMLVGNIENAQAFSPLFTSFSSSAVPRMPPTKLIRLLVRGSSMPK